EVDDQAIQTILLGLPEDIYAAVDSCKITQEIWLRVQQMMKGSDIGIQEKKAKNGNLVAVRAEGNAAGHNGNQIRCYNYRGVDILLETALSGQGEGMLLIFRHSC
nr:hypothetical protein [Tanacetum cinerariifolium]